MEKTKEIIRTSLPLIFANLLNSIYSLTDIFWAGKLGIKDIAAISSSSPFIFLIYSIFISFGIGLTILISQNVKNNKKIKTYFSTTIIAFFFLSLIFSLFILVFIKNIFSIFNLNKEVCLKTIAYSKILIIAFPIGIIYFIQKSLFNGLGKTKFIFYLTLFSAFINFILDPLLAIYFHLGIEGIALATFFGDFILVLISFYLLKDFLTLNLDFNFLKEHFFISSFISLEFIFLSLGKYIIFYFVSSFGTLVIAAYGIGRTIFNFIMAIRRGLVMSITIYVGNNIKRADEIMKYMKSSIILNFLSFSLISFILFIFPREIVSFFGPPSNENILYIRIISISLFFISLSTSFKGLFRGLGKTNVSFIVSFFSTLISIIFAFLFRDNYFLVFLSLFVKSIFEFLLYIFYFLKTNA